MGLPMFLKRTQVHFWRGGQPETALFVTVTAARGGQTGKIAGPAAFHTPHSLLCRVYRLSRYCTFPQVPLKCTAAQDGHDVGHRLRVHARCRRCQHAPQVVVRNLPGSNAASPIKPKSGRLMPVYAPAGVCAWCGRWHRHSGFKQSGQHSRRRGLRCICPTQACAPSQSATRTLAGGRKEEAEAPDKVHQACLTPLHMRAT